MHSHKPSCGLPPPATRPTETHKHIINQAVGCHYFLPGLQLPSQPSSITALRPVPSYTAWWQRNIGVRNLPRVFTPLRNFSIVHNVALQHAALHCGTVHCVTYCWKSRITHQGTFSFFRIWVYHCWKLWIRMKLQYSHPTQCHKKVMSHCMNLNTFNTSVRADPLNSGLWNLNSRS